MKVDDIHCTFSTLTLLVSLFSITTQARDLEPVVVYEVMVMKNRLPESVAMYWIPIMAIGPIDSTLVLFAEARLASSNDFSTKNLVYKYSSDNGFTWLVPFHIHSTNNNPTWWKNRVLPSDFKYCSDTDVHTFNCFCYNVCNWDYFTENFNLIVWAIFLFMPVSYKSKILEETHFSSNAKFSRQNKIL